MKYDLRKIRIFIFENFDTSWFTKNHVLRRVMDTTPQLQSSPIKALEPFIGTWRGEGTGFYPTIKVFNYGEEVEFSTWGKPVVGYS